MKIQIPEILTRRPAFLKRKPVKPHRVQKLRAGTASRRLSPAMDDDYDEEPTTRLSSAFFVVLILHLVAVGGIWAFNSIKAHRRGIEPAPKVLASNSGSEAHVKAPAVSTPEAGSSTAPYPQPKAVAPLSPVATTGSGGKNYQVKANDTLTKIANSLGVTVAELLAVNSQKEIAVLRPGQTINVPARRVSEPTSVVERPPVGTVAKRIEDVPSKAGPALTYAVRKGDTATSIARRFGISVDELLKLNRVTDPKKLQLGQSLKLPASR